MKKIILLSSVALLGLLSSCDDDYIDQFNVDSSITDVVNLSYKLEGSDYATITGLSANKELALAKDPENPAYVEALAAVGEDKYFTDNAPAEDYIPAFLVSKYPNADIGSKFTVAYNQYQAPSAYLDEFKNISSYELTENDYKTVWGENINASFLSPSSVSKIPVLLNENMPSSEKGDMVVVNYAYSELEPSTGGDSGEVSYTKISDVIANTAGADYTVKGEVIATYGRGFLVGDGTASILVYVNAPANYSVGDVVSVSGTTSSYSGLMQFPNSAVITLLERNTSFAFPAPVAMTGAELESYMDAPSVKYVSYKGTLTISGNYYNIAVEGATRQGSISYPVAGVVDTGLNGKEVTVTGYLIGGSSKFVNTMVTSVVAADATSEYTPVGVVALSEAGAYKVKGVVAATYARGFLLTDGTGNILVYLNAAHDYKAGDVVTVSGTTTKYSGLMQFPNTSEVAKVSDGSFTTPAPRELTVDNMEAYLTAPYAGYVSYEGRLSISGNYYNVIIDGTSLVQGSLSYPGEGVVDASLDGKKVVVTGYAIGVSSGKFLNTMTTSVTVATEKARTASFASRAAITPNEAALYVYTGTTWSIYTNTDANVSVVDPTVYASLGSEYISAPETVLPIFLTRTYPYAEEGAKVAVVYNKKADTPTVNEYTFNGTWAETTTSVPATLVFTKEANGSIAANMSVYLSETFLGSEGGFTIQNVALGGISSVWTNTPLYGWKATAYLNNTNYTAESWIVSPAIDFKKATAPVMTFDEAHRYLNGADPTKYFGVMLSTDYKGDVTTCTWTTLPVEEWSDGSTWDFVNVGTINLSEYNGMTVHVAFKYTSDDAAAATWEVKNLKIYEEGSEE